MATQLGIPAVRSVARTVDSDAEKAPHRLYHRAIKLTFVPNQFCNLGCKYCYLGELTNNRDDPSNVVAQFRQTAAHLEHQGILIDSLLLHGAEISILPQPVLRELFQEYTDYRRRYRSELKALGGRGASIHIKTNLYNFDVLRELYEEFEISISGSFDLPFSLHDELRVTKSGKSTLRRTLDNVIALADYPHRKQISCVVGTEHLARIDEFIHDIEWLDAQGFDMVCDFYIMFAYDSSNVDYVSQLNQEEMLQFFTTLLEHFRGTKFEKAIYYEWFKEFTHDYCTNQINCGKNNFLVQKDGDVYPCHRGQAEPALKFGNLLEMTFEEMVNSGEATIRAYEQANEPLSDECISCEYFYLCYAGCPIERNNTGGNRSYTCSIQKALYKAQPQRFPPKPEVSRRMVDSFLRQNQPRRYDDLSVPRVMKFNPEMFEEKNALNAIIARDKELQELFRPGAIMLMKGAEEIPLYSSHLYGRGVTVDLQAADDPVLVISKSYWGINCSEGALNALKLQLLRDTQVIYGDEQRKKMEHVASIDVYPAELEELDDVFLYHLGPFLEQHAHVLLPGTGNLLSVTTIKAREYHYAKHSKNAFYHMETINLPFHEFRFSFSSSQLPAGTSVAPEGPLGVGQKKDKGGKQRGEKERGGALGG